MITGGAGFIGFFLSKSLLEKGAKIIGIDNLNDYYEVSLKEERLRILNGFADYTFLKADIANKEAMFRIFEEYKPDIVVNLATQAGCVTTSVIRMHTYSQI